MRVRVQLRTGDRVIIAGALGIAAYEKFVRDDDDLISNRVACYRALKVKARDIEIPVGRIITDAVLLATYLHLTESVSPEWDVYHQAMKIFRKAAEAKEPS